MPHTNTHTHTAHIHPCTALEATHSVSSTVTMTSALRLSALVFEETQKRSSRERRLIRKPRSLVQGYHGDNDVVRVGVCITCVRMEVGESETAQGRCEENGMSSDEGQNMDCGPQKKIEAAVVILKACAHTLTHTNSLGFKGHCFIYQAVKFLPCLC